MKNLDTEISLYVDAMIMETLLSDHHLLKTAQESTNSSILDKIKEYVGNHINENDKAGSVLNLLAPAGVSMVLGGLGFPMIGKILGFLMSVFHVDTHAIVSSAFNSIKSEISSGKQVSSQQVNQIIDEAIKPYDTPLSEEEALKAEQDAKQLESRNFYKELKDAKLFKLALIEYEKNSLKKDAGILSDLLSPRKSSMLGIFGTVLRILFKIVLASAGFMVAGDVANKILGRPNAFDGSVQKGQPVSNSFNKTIQTKFKLNPSYHEVHRSDNWVENISNDRGSIGNMVLSWAKQVYQGLDNLDNIIISTPGFQTVVETITYFNKKAAGSSSVFIPSAFTSKKSAVDVFIDEVAEKAT